MCDSCTPPEVKAERSAKANAELKEAGMSQEAIDGLQALDRKFTAGFKEVSGNQEATHKFVADFTAESKKFMASMAPGDREIYDAFCKKNGIDNS